MKGGFPMMIYIIIVDQTVIKTIKGNTNKIYEVVILNMLINECVQAEK